MLSALIVSDNNRADEFFGELLKNAGFDRSVVASSFSQARRIFAEYEFSLCIINSPVGSDSGVDFAMSAALDGSTPVIICAAARDIEKISFETEDYGIIAVEKPVNKLVMWNGIKVALNIGRRVQKIRDENRRLSRELEDIKLTDTAKYILVSVYSMTEAEAHRYIEKQAMDRRVSKREIAERIIENNEN